MHCVIGIDIGTGSTKALAVNDNGEVLFSTQKSYPTIRTDEGNDEQDPEIIWDAFIDCIKGLLPKLKAYDIIIVLSSAMHSLLAVDKRGVHLTPLMIWSDKRSAAIAEKLKGSEKGEIFYKATGTPVHAMSPLCKIKWLKENKAAIFKKTLKFISIKEFIWWKLFSTYEVDYSIASATGLFEIKTLAWYKKSLQWAGITASQLSTAVNVFHTRKNIDTKIAANLKMPGGTQFMIGASDGCLANLGSFATEPGIAAITIGSSGAVRILSKKPILQYPSMPFSYRLDSENFICGGPINNGGIVMQWLLKIFLGINIPTSKDYDYLFEQIENIRPGCEGLIFLPYISGERAPVWDAKSCGCFVGLGIHHQATHMMRAAVEGVCFSVLDALQMMEENTGPIKQLQVSGGFTQSIKWLQLLADVTGRKLNLVSLDDASALGAAYLALQSRGISYTKIPPVKTIEPQMNHHRNFLEHFSIYKTLYPSLKLAMHQLYQLKH